MKQIQQDVRSGETRLESVPPPMIRPGFVRIRTEASLISAGTEKMMIDLAKKSLLGKARARPDLVRQVLDKARKEGMITTIRNVLSKMDNPIPLGYSAAGVVEEVGEGIESVRTGDRVAFAGAGYANHAEINVVPGNLVARVPDGVSPREACYATVASIALQGVRLARPEIGEHVVVLGLGLLGLITLQILQANGCRVIGIDVDEGKVRLGKELGLRDGIVAGATDPVRAVAEMTGGRGADATIITAATRSDEPISTAGEITRRKGKVVIVGAVGMNIPRDVYYKKELDLQISMSYGPGRYDPTYEEGGIDYPYDYVRWTEQRNLEAVVGLMSEGKLNVAAITSHEIPFEEALSAYRMIHEGSEPYVGVVLTYSSEPDARSVVPVKAIPEVEPRDRLRLGFIGAGNYADIQLLPHLRKSDRVVLARLMSATGIKARQKAEKFGFQDCTTDAGAVISDPEIDAVFIATRHRTHAEFVSAALRAGKHVFVEKPVVVHPHELDEVIDAYESANSVRATALMVGLNRRFAPMVRELKSAFRPSTVLQMAYRVNSGFIPTDTWLHEEAEGGGMLVGEMCHFVDLMQFLCGETPVRVSASSLTLDLADTADLDNISITVAFSGGSTGTLVYSTVGNKAAPKERVEVFGGGVAAVLDDFRALEVFDGNRRKRSRARNQDKGQSAQLRETIEGMAAGGQAPIPFSEIVMGMRIIFAAREAARTSRTVELEAYTASER